MATIVFFNIPAYGHTNPTLGVVAELVQRGNNVHYYSFDEFKARIEATGAHFISCDGYDVGIKQSDAARVAKDMRFSTELIVRATLAMDEQLMRDMSELAPDCIVADSVAYWGKLIAHKLHIPFVSSTTTFSFNSKSSAIMKPSFCNMIKILFDVPKTTAILTPLRKKGYEAHTIFDIVQNTNDTNTVVYTSKLFQPCADSFSSAYHFVGPVLRTRTEKIEKKREKLVYISLGTVDTLHTGFYKNCIDALCKSNIHVIMSCGKQTDIIALQQHAAQQQLAISRQNNILQHSSSAVRQLGDTPSSSAHFDIEMSVDQIAVLEKADMFLSHCGMNSANESLYFGVPLVLFPQTTEQNGVANRIAQLGAGIFLKRNTARTIRNAIETVLASKSYKENARKIGESFRQSGGAHEAARVIEAVAKQRK